MTKPKLAPRQQVAYDFIRSHIEENGWPPTVREIGDEMDVAVGAVTGYLNWNQPAFIISCMMIAITQTTTAMIPTIMPA